MTDTPHFLQVLLDVPVGLADAASALAVRSGAKGVEVRDAETLVPEGAEPPTEGRAHVLAWLSAEVEPESVAAEVTAALHRAEPDAEVRVRFEQVDAEDWVEKVRAQVKPVRLGRRILIRPSWTEPDPNPPADQIEVVLDPGLAFGTGQHATTALCLEALESLVDGRKREGTGPTVLDVGTGTGILAIVAVRLGASRALANDNDPVAVRVARENVEDAGLSDRIEVTQLPPDRLEGLWDLAVANIQLGPLTDLAPGIAARVAPGGDVLLSGLLAEQVDEATGAYAAQGLEPVSHRLLDGWALVHLRRPLL